MTVLPFLTTRPQTKRELAARMGVPVRVVERMVEAERLEGAPIVSDGDGYRRALHSDEMFDLYRRLRSRYIRQAVNARHGALATALRMRREEDAAVRPPAVLFPELESAA